MATSLTYFDVSTPLIWSPEGRLPASTSTCSPTLIPAVLRWPLRRFVAPGILDTYRDLRKVYLDLAGNLLEGAARGLAPGFPGGAQRTPG